MWAIIIIFRIERKKRINNFWRWGKKNWLYIQNERYIYKKSISWIYRRKIKSNINKFWKCWMNTKSKNQKDIEKSLNQGRDNSSIQTEPSSIFYTRANSTWTNRARSVCPIPLMFLSQASANPLIFKRTLTYVTLKNKNTGLCYMHIIRHLDYKVK